MNRGEIRNLDAAKQVCDFSGLRFGTITPTNIDGSLDFAGKYFIFFDAKFEGATCPLGQRRHLEYQCRSHIRGGAPALALILRHSTPVDIPIPVASCLVDELFDGDRWRPPTRQITCRAAIEKWMALNGVMV